MGFWNFLTGSTPAGVISETGQRVVAGVFQGVGEMIDRFHLSPEDAQQFKLELAKMELESYKTQISDIQSARAMQAANRSPWPGILTAIIIFGFYGVLGITIMKGLPSTNAPGGEAILMLIGSLTTGLASVLAFWFGSTQGARAKDDMLANSIPVSSVSTVVQSNQHLK